MSATLLPLLLLAAAPAAAPAQPPRTEKPVTQTAEHNIAVVKKMIAAWDARDGNAIAELFTPDGVLHSMMIEPIIGRETIRPRMKFLVDNATHMKINVRNIAATGNTVFLERWDEFTFRGHDGKVPVVGVLVIEGDKVKEWREYYDRAELLEAMGVPGGF